MYDYTCTGIFERHKLMFSFQMTIMIMEGEGQLSRPELTFFLKGDVALEAVARACPFEWVQPQGWKDLLLLGTMGSAFETIVADVEHNAELWKAWYDLEMPETSDLPMGYQDRLTPFQVCGCRCGGVGLGVRVWAWA